MQHHDINCTLVQCTVQYITGSSNKETARVHYIVIISILQIIESTLLENLTDVANA